MTRLAVVAVWIAVVVLGSINADGSVSSQSWRPAPFETVRVAQGWNEDQWYWYAVGLVESMWMISERFASKGNYWESEAVVTWLDGYFRGVEKNGNSMRKYNRKVMAYVKGLKGEMLELPLVVVLYGKLPKEAQ